MPDLRPRIIESAIDLTITDGWSAITMDKVAQRAGVSRQTVYNEIGGKPQLARAMVQHELGAFLLLVDQAFVEQRNPDDALRSAARAVLAYAESHPLLGVIVSGGASDLLDLLTVDAGQLQAVATSRLMHLHPGMRDGLADVVVRLILSYLTRPAETLEEAQVRVDDVMTALLTAPSSHRRA